MLTPQKKKNQPITIDRASAGFLLLVNGSQYKNRFSSFLFVQMVENNSTTNNSNSNRQEKRKKVKSGDK
jgi:cob(I)alamin adenosyltransferase